ncbi:AglZ/HisF2 family acetamidino modification protein [Sediminibacterium sp.]|uniref:AglZ/HisF2 family acetamidino modification protein n=1 Tax=Sediminibacterium sp. TaxID=1917865 RepID=UPI002735AEA5|nr:AglZ/HisF2 family acetamidino modification protein [Sediminibacterium sp.]MDP3392415.1 AglZ/HisF2 family acetamidino modification protein [Sediminibacterium sp.]MDP3565681.1 AglZ/HisF2 family acetamidino modification protein [Sediminibacterium sp.]
MLRSRIIPCLLVHQRGLVKTVKFKDPKYVGDPINAVKIFNEKEVDELIVLDIDATAENRGPDFELIKNLATECRMPFCYGGGITTVEQAKTIINLGAEKLAISAAAVRNFPLLKEIGHAVGMQSVIVVIDVKKKALLGGYDVYIRNGKEKTDLKLKHFLEDLNRIGVGEIVINSIDRDGTMSGYDYELADMVRTITDMPITILGGARDFEDIKKMIKQYKVIGAAAGSLFVFKGKYRAVLISYPDKQEKLNII